jgi:hypothetical protein
VKLTQIAVLLSGAALSASVFAADDHLGIPHNVDENDLASWYRPIATPTFSGSPAAQQIVRFGDENDTSWMTPKTKPAFSGNDTTAAAGQLGIPHDLDENALAMGYAPSAKSTFAGYGVRSNGAGL